MHGAEATCRERLGVGERLREGADSRRAYARRGRRVNALPPTRSTPRSREQGAGSSKAWNVPLPAPSTAPRSPLPAPCSLSVPLPKRREVNHSSPIGGWLTSAGVILITMKLLRTCYTPRPSGPPRLVGLRHDCCEVERCVHAMLGCPLWLRDTQVG